MSDRAIASALNSSVRSMGSCTLSLKQATSALEMSVSDFPRLASVLQHDRCFELVTASELRNAQFSVASQIEPHIKDLMKKAEASVLQLEQKHLALNAKAVAAQKRQERLEQAKDLQAKLDQLRAEKQQLAALLESE